MTTLKFFIKIIISEITEITVRHKKYKTRNYVLEPGKLIEFETITPPTPISFIITGNKSLVILGMEYTSLTKLEKISILKQEINKIDIVPARTKFLKTHEYTQTKALPFMRMFKSMQLKPNDTAMIRFFIPVTPQGE
jgi:hypothetical protein